MSDAASTIRRLFPTRSPGFRAIRKTLEKIVDSEANVLLLGESGVGKDHVAQAIHATGPRRSAAFIRIDCPSIPAELFESELFGHERGTFTDALERKIGKVEMAHRGTLYFDEIGALTPPLQAKLLRVIQEKRFSRLGGTRTIEIDVRILSSSNLALSQLLESGAIRKDLYYRLNVVSVTMPSLRQRKEDIPMLSKAFLRDSSRRQKKRINGFSPAALELLLSYAWPGNIRELKNVIDRAVILETSSEITGQSLPTERFVTGPDLVSAAAASSWTLDQLESRYIREVLRQTGSNYSKAARLLGINRKTLLEKRRRYGIE